MGVPNRGAVLQFGEDCSAEDVRTCLGSGIVERPVDKAELAFGGLAEVVDVFGPR